MKKGKELGIALANALAEKRVSQTELANQLMVKKQAVSKWVNSGAIGKKHLFNVFEYFSDVVGPEHWGISESILVSQRQDDVTKKQIERAIDILKVIPESDKATRELVQNCLLSIIEKGASFEPKKRISPQRTTPPSLMAHAAA